MPKEYIDPGYAMSLMMNGLSEAEIMDAVERFGDNFGTYDMLSEMHFGKSFDELENEAFEDPWEDDEF